MARVSALEEYGRRLGIRTDIQGHLQFLHETVLSYDRPSVIELGIQDGNSTSALLSAVIERDGALYSCDIQTRGELAADRGPERRVPPAWWDEPRWKVFHGDDLSAQALAWMPERCDVLFVDSDHSYEHVLATLGAYMPRVGPGGVALFHDTQYERRDFWDHDLGRPGGEVARALGDYCEPRGIAWENRPGSYGMGVIRP